MRHIFRILKSAHELWRYYLVIAFLTILLSLMSLSQPLLSGWAIDEIGKGSNVRFAYLVMLAIFIFSLDLLATLVSNIGGYLGDQMSVKLNKILSSRYYQHVLELPQTYFDNQLSGKIINRLNRSIVQITNFMQMMSNNFLQFIFSTVFALVVVARYSWPVAIMLILLYPIYIWMTFRSSGKWLNYQAKKNLHTDIASGRFAEAISQIKVVKSFIQEKRELHWFNRQMQIVVNTNRPQSKFWHVRDIQRRLVLNIIFFGVYIYIFIAGANGSLTPGQVVALILYAMQIRIPIFTISFLVENNQKAIADSRDYFEIMNIEPEELVLANRQKLKINRGEIIFQDVKFGYDNHSPVLNNINFKIKPDTKVAFVGESGEGKSTIVNLILGLYQLQSGQIIIDNQNISRINQASLRSQIGVVFQDPALFSGTIFENIAYANPRANSSQVIAAAKAANAHQFISKFAKNYQTQIGEHGLKLSGGQKQRIAIARALLKDAPILILDEATSSLDNRSELLVQQALERLMKGRTTLIIAHRLSTIEHVDTIVSLKQGRVSEMGSPRQLAKSGGIYANLLQIQKTAKPGSKQLKAFQITG